MTKACTPPDRRLLGGSLGGEGAAETERALRPSTITVRAAAKAHALSEPLAPNLLRQLVKKLEGLRSIGARLKFRLFSGGQRFAGTLYAVGLPVTIVQHLSVLLGLPVTRLGAELQVTIDRLREEEESNILIARSEEHTSELQSRFGISY